MLGRVAEHRNHHDTHEHRAEVSHCDIVAERQSAGCRRLRLRRDLARLLANLLLLNHGYLPCIVHSIDRQRYYDSLRLPEPQLREIMMEAMENGLESAEKFFAAAAAPRTKKVAR